MKYRINSYQVIYRSGARDKVKLSNPIFTRNLHNERVKLIKKLTAPGCEVAGLNLEAEEIEE